jgi:hypothetical protein
VLGRGEHAVRIGEPVALVPLDHGGAELTDEQRVFPEGFTDAAPARVASDAEHGRKRPDGASGCHLARRDAAHLAQQVRIPRASHGERARKDGRTLVERMPVNGVLGDEQRDAEARLECGLERGLEGVVQDVQERARRVPLHLPYRIVAPVELQHLPDLFGQCHAFEQVVEAPVDGLRGIAINGRGHGAGR